MLSLKRTRPNEVGPSRGTSAAAAAEDDRPTPRPHVGAELIVVLLVTLGLAGAGVYLASRSDSLGVDARSSLVTACLVMVAVGLVAFLLSWRRRVDWSRVEVALSDRAGRDPLTGLADRVALTERLTARLGSRGSPTATRPAVLFCDLDHFRRINDTYGHRCGDHVLVAAGQRFANVLRTADTIGRIDGDKFVVICPVVSAPEAMATAERLLGCLENPFAVGGHTVRVTASIGVAVADGSKSDPESLLRDADHAVAQAKRAGRERAVLFSSSMRPRTTAGGAEQLRLALAQEQFRLVYQPVVSSFDGSIVGVEALLRWDHPALGVVMPSDFIPQLEETGLIVDVGRWVLRESCRQAAEWIAAIPGLSLRTTVNVSARQLAEPDFRDTVASALNEAGLRPEGLCLELTEGTMLLDTVAAWARLREVKLLGVGLALDDFGTGFSSLSFVRQFSVDMIKIDRSFVQGVTLNAEDRAIVAAVAGIANGLGIVCVAEGVETREQALELRALGCGLLQGHLASPPAAPEQITAMLAADVTRRSREAVVLDGR